MAPTNCGRCKKTLDEADVRLNERRYEEYMRRYPQAELSDNFGDWPVFQILCGTCTATEMKDEAERRRNQGFFDSMLQGGDDPDLAKNLLIIALVIIVLGALLLGRG